MAKLFITEFRQQGKAANEAVAGSLEVPPIRTQVIEYADDDSSKMSVEFDGATELVLLLSTSPCFIAFGREPEAVKDHFALVAGRDLFSVPKGHAFRVAVISAWGAE